jgi:DNA-binding MarR family transcriptional regulator
MTKDDLFNRTAKLISKVHDFETSLSGQGGDDEVTALQFDLMQILYFTGQKNLSGLSHCLNINLPNCSREVKKLTNLGFIEKNSSVEDRRKTELSLSGIGAKKVESFLEEMKSRFFDQSTDWNADRIERCISSIDILEQEIFK